MSLKPQSLIEYALILVLVVVIVIVILALLQDPLSQLWQNFVTDWCNNIGWFCP